MSEPIRHPATFLSLTLGLTMISVPLASPVSLYRLSIRAEGGDEVVAALLPSSTTTYGAPSWLWDRAGVPVVQWQVVGLAADGSEVMSTPWRRISAVVDQPGG